MEKNISFIKKVWYSITKFEKYPDMATEGLKKAIKYLIILIALVSIFISMCSLWKIKNSVNDLAQYIEDNIPDFQYSEGKINIETEEPIVIDNIKYAGVDKIIINTKDDENEIEDDVKGTTIFFLNDKIMLKIKAENDQTMSQSFTYTSFISNYTKDNIETFNKLELLQYLRSSKMSNFYTQYSISSFIVILISNVIISLVDALEIAIFGIITTRIARIKMRFKAIYNMSIYALTLSIVLNAIYVIANYLTDFTITYFQVAYITIAYIYLAAAIFILKDDVIKKMQEIEDIRKEQENVKKEIERNDTENE